MRKKSNNASLILTIVLSAILGGGIYIYFSSMFERNTPTIVIDHSEYWNLKTSLNIKIDDESGVKSYKIVMKSGDEEKVLQYEQLIDPKNSLVLEVQPPRSTYTIKSSVEIVVEATDLSKWNFLKGNKAKKTFKYIIDRKRPQLNIVNNSYKISRGGSAIVIFKVDDENLQDIYIKSNNDKVFHPQPFYKEGYYISLLAWPVVDKNFKATVIAKDKAGNIAKAYIPLYLKQKSYRVSHMKISDKFLKGKIADLAEEFVETQGVQDSIEQFKIINEDVRAKNEQLIHELTSKINTKKIESFNINKMYPLKNAQVVATFGDHRKYSYNGKNISFSYHLGLDLASNSMASIKPQNGGEVVFSDYNGLYGNMPLIHHGLGLYTLYGHCSSVKVNTSDNILKREVIANTGKSGYAMGDHLHFGVLVQGIEVRPQEWMDSQWIDLNVNNIIKEAKKIIDRN